MEKLAIHGGQPVREKKIYYGRQCIEDLNAIGIYPNDISFLRKKAIFFKGKKKIYFFQFFKFCTTKEKI